MYVELRAWGVAWALVAVRDVAGLVEPGLEQAGTTQMDLGRDVLFNQTT